MPYTAVAAVIVGAVAKPTPEHPHPDQLTLWRWIVFAVLLAATFLSVWGLKRTKARGRFPVAEVVGAVVAAAGWAMTLPASPLVPYLGSPASSVAPAVAAFTALAINFGIATILQGQRGGT